LAIVNLFYPPDLAPTGHFAASLAEHRAESGDEVTVICGKGAYLGGSSARTSRAAGQGEYGSASRSPRVIRLWTPEFGKASTVRRLGDYLVFLVGAIARMATLPRQDVIVVLTSPPYIVVAAVAHRLLHRRTRIVLWSQDVYPDAAEEYGTIRAGGMASRALRAAQAWLFRHIDHVVALDRAMLDRQLSQYARDGRPTGSVIPNWEPLGLFPAGRRPKRWSAYDDAQLTDRFVVLYLGNLGYGHPTHTIVEAASRMAGDAVAFLFVGGGVRYAELEATAKRRNLDNVLLRGYVPKEETPSVLAGAGCVLVSLDQRSLGIMSPCKPHGGLAMGIPVVYVGPAGTNVDEAIAAYRCGFSLRHGDVEGLVSAIRRLRDDRELAAEISLNARRAFEDAYCDARTLPQFDGLLGRMTNGADIGSRAQTGALGSGASPL
jgi:glycosyltransferase involved in cell wall biosynthesis